MAASLADIHYALAGRLATIDGLHAFPYPPQGATPPIAGVRLLDWAVDAFGRQGPRMLTFEIVVLTAETARPQDGYRLLTQFADGTGVRSIDTAIWDGCNRQAGTFTGTYEASTYTCANTLAQVTGFRVLGREEMDEFQMYGGAFTVTVHTAT